MLRNAFYAATYWAPVLVVLLFIGARLAAPFPYAAPDLDQTVTTSLITAAQERSDSGAVYVRVDGADPSPVVLADLNRHHLPANFAAWSLRPHGGCPPKYLCSGDADNPRDDFLAADLLSMPLWHVALVRVTSRTCSAELTLVRGSEWHVLSQRTACT